MASVPKIGIESNTFGARAVRGRILGAAIDASQQVIEGSGYGTDDPRSVDWAGIVNADPTLRFGQLRLNMSQAQKLQIVDEKGRPERGQIRNWGALTDVNVYDVDKNQSNYRHDFDPQYGPFPYPFNNGTAVGSNLGTWNWSGAPDDLFTLTWQPKRGYIGAAPPLPVQIDGTNPPKFDFLNLTTSSTSSSWPR